MMKSRFARWLLAICMATLVSGCANHKIPILGADSSPLQVRQSFTPVHVQPINPRRPIDVVVHTYQDGRSDAPTRRIGEIRNTFVSDMTGTEIAIDQDVADLVTAAMKRQLTAMGYHVLEGDVSTAAFAVGGSIEKFTLDVVARDKVDIEVQTRLTDPATGAVIWSGTVKEKKERFPGVSGDSRASLVGYLDESLGRVTEKTVKTLTASLVQSQPGLFLQAGVPTPGVTVQAAPHAQGEGRMPVPTDIPPGTGGELSVTTVPAGVQVYVGDVYYGLSPLSLKLAPGIYSVRLTATGYRDVRQKVSVRSGETTKWRVRLQRLSTSSTDSE